MLNYEEIVTQAHAHRMQRLAQAEQQRLVQALAAPQPHPLFVWAGRQMRQWHWPWRGEKGTSILPVPPMMVSR